MCAQIQFSVGAGACGRPRASLFSPVESIAGSWSSKSSMRTGPLICDAINGRRLKRATPGQPGGEATAAAMAVVRIRPMSSIFFRQDVPIARLCSESSAEAKSTCASPSNKRNRSMLECRVCLRARNLPNEGASSQPKLVVDIGSVL